MNEPINWSYVSHIVSDMRNDEEFQPARVCLPDGTIVEIIKFVKDARGQWTLVAREVKHE